MNADPRLRLTGPVGRHGRRQRGLASLLVVMVLFFVVSLLAAYTNRNLIFEQKTSGNQYRGTQGFEAAEAGLNWALSMLNGGRIDANCNPTPNTPANSSFQQRYLSISSTGFIQATTRTGNWPTCVFNASATAPNNAWTGNCACPDATSASPTPPPTSTANQPAFRIWPAPGGLTATPPTDTNETIVASASKLTLQSVGCTRMPQGTPGCLDYVPKPDFGDGVARLQQVVALRSALAVPPSAALMARGTVTPAPGIARLRVVNTDNITGGITVQAGDTGLNTNQMQLESFPGTPGDFTVSRDAILQNMAVGTGSPTGTPLTVGERMFVSIFGLRRKVYEQQPGVRVCDAPCTASGANGTNSLNALLAANPNRVIWVKQSTTVATTPTLVVDAPIGSANSPAMLIVDGGKIVIQNGGLTPNDITGVVYITGGPGSALSTIELPDAPVSLVGALIVEGALQTSYTVPVTSPTNQLTVSYDPSIVNLIRWTYGSWVRSPSGWRDFDLTNPP